ncbi:MAG: GntR family transcriptional regulator [Planctomycetes bacterium]|nr:GntR family transcriptional regulator [Planctomycetota bacterium]
MHLRLEPNSGVPLGFQIVEQLRLAIASGRLQPGEKLPSARDLAGKLQVNFHTVRKAYGDLEREGLLCFERGKGTFVAANARKMNPDDLRRLVRAHVERLAGDLAGVDFPPEKIVELVGQELLRVFRGRKDEG